MRGVHFSTFCFFSQSIGSSPHARGPRSIFPINIDQSGIIPACAGSTNGFTFRLGRNKDHPCMRGVHLAVKVASAIAQGSSPHARGPLLLLRVDSFEPGFIPACAGSTVQILGNPGRTAVHPRMRGVHSQWQAGHCSSLGSSPHARGPPVQKPEKVWVQRFIPACAGSTRLHAGMGVEDQVHPRMRGVHPCRCLRPGISRGSSPHARGPLAQNLAQFRWTGFIPACAGSTTCQELPYRP